MNSQTATEIVKEISMIFEKEDDLYFNKRENLHRISKIIFEINTDQLMKEIIFEAKKEKTYLQEITDFVSLSYLGLVDNYKPFPRNGLVNGIWVADAWMCTSFTKTFTLSENELYERLKLIHKNCSFQEIVRVFRNTDIEEITSIPHIRLLLSSFLHNREEMFLALGLEFIRVKENSFRLSKEIDEKRSFEQVPTEETEIFRIVNKDQFEKSKVLLFSNDLNLSFKEIEISNIASTTTTGYFCNALFKLLYTDEVVTSLVLEHSLNCEEV